MPKSQNTNNSLSNTGDLSNETLGSARGKADPGVIVSKYCALFGEHTALADLFRKNISYFEDPDIAQKAAYRVTQIPSLIRSSGLVELAPKAERSQSLLDAIFLIAVHGNLKEIVYEKGTLVRSELQSRGYKTNTLLNLLEPGIVKTTLEQVMEERLIKNTQPLSNQLLFTTGHTLTDFHQYPELFSIFSDDFAAALRDTLQRRISDLGETHSKIAFIEEMLSSIEPVTSGGLTVELVTRDKSCLIQGALAGDCTAPGSLNGWTVGPWACTYENLQFRFTYQGSFFARTVATAGYILEKDGIATPSQWHHAIEFSPLARVSDSGSKLADPKLQQELFSDLVAFSASYAKASGCGSSYLTTISNSFGFGKILTSLLAGEKQFISPRPSMKSFILPSPLRTAHEIRRMLHPEFTSTDTPISTYLQGMSGRASYKLSAPTLPQIEARENEISRAQEQENEPTPAIQGITREQLEVVSRLFMGKGEEVIKRSQDELELLSASSYRAALKEAIFAKDTHTSLGKSFRRIQAAAKPLIEQIDPGAVEDFSEKFSKSLKVAVKNCEEIIFRASIVNMEGSQAEVRNIETLSAQIVKDLNSALRRNALRSPSDVTKIVKSLLPAQGSTMLYEEDEMDSPFYSSSEDEYDDLLESLEVGLTQETTQQSTPLLDCISSSLADSGALEILLNGGALSKSVEKKFLRELLHSYFISQSTKVDLKSLEAKEEIESILSQKSDDSDANFLSYRPSEWAQLHKHLRNFLKNASFSREINAESYVSLVGRLSPDLLEDFAKSLVEPGNVLLNLSEREADAVMNNLPILVEFYKHVSERKPKGRRTRENSLLCKVNLFTIYV